MYQAIRKATRQMGGILPAMVVAFLARIYAKFGLDQKPAARPKAGQSHEHLDHHGLC